MQNTNNTPPGLGMGALVGVLMTAPVVAIFFLADAIIGLPLLPLDLVDWAARNLPGNLLTTGIDIIVETNRTLGLGSTDEFAKTAEQLTGILALVIASSVVAVIAFAVFARVMKRQQVMISGVLIGLVYGVILAFFSRDVNFTATTGELTSFIWITGVFSAWGLALAWVFNDMVVIPASASSANSVEQIDRRQFLVRLGGATATLTVVGAGLGFIFSREPEAVTTATVQDTTSTTAQSTTEAVVSTVAEGDLVPAPGTRPEYTPLEDHYRIDISTRPPNIDGQTWVLPITGLVNNPMNLTMDDLMAYESMDQYITLSCISNRLGGDLISTTKWTGVSFKKILEELDLQPEGKFARITAADDFDEYFDLSIALEDERVMLAYHWDDRPLLQKHGFPLRIYIPDRYGMKQPKWITGIEIIDAWDEGFWVRRGWSREAIVNTTSVIDTVAVDEAYEDEDGTMRVPVGGIAYSGARGIARVEVSVDGGEWQEARLKEPLSDITWVIWRYDWQFEEGAHAFQVRCVDGNGMPQSELEQGVRPDGATGIHLYRI